MKVTVERAQLLQSLGHVHRVVERRNTLPILGNVLIRSEKSRLSLKATDLDLEVTETLAAETGTGGSTTVPAHMFYDIVRKLPDGAQIVLEGDGDRSVLAIRAGRSRFTLQTLPENDFPDLAAGDMTHSFKLAAADVKRLIDRTQFAISTEETRYYLNGIYLHTAGSATAPTLRAVATDGHRLAQIDLPLPSVKRILPCDNSILISASWSSISRCTSPTVLRGTITPGMSAAPFGCGRSTCASRWPSVATARNTGCLALPAACR